MSSEAVFIEWIDLDGHADGVDDTRTYTATISQNDWGQSMRETCCPRAFQRMEEKRSQYSFPALSSQVEASSLPLDTR